MALTIFVNRERERNAKPDIPPSRTIEITNTRQADRYMRGLERKRAREAEYRKWQQRRKEGRA